MAKDKDKDDRKDLSVKSKSSDGVREDQLLRDKDKTDAELETLDAAQDKKDGKGDPKAREKEAARDEEASGMYHLKEDELIRHLSHLHSRSDDHERRLRDVEGGRGRADNPEVAPVCFTASDMQGMMNQIVREALAAHEIKKDFAQKYPDEDIRDIGRKLSSMGVDLSNPAHAAFIESISMQQDPGRLYKELSERPEIIRAVSETHPMFHRKALDELKTGIKGKVDDTPQDRVDNAVDDDREELRKRHDQEGDLIRKIYGKR